jgi:AcrR family transcriptional regulator
MSADGQTPTIRDAHRDLTQARILDAAIDLLRNEDLDELKMGDIARQAGVTERTLYRHFSTRDDLLKAVWPRLQARVGSAGFPASAKDLLALPLWLFPNFDRENGAVKASTFSKAGREIRRAVSPARNAALLKAVREARPDLDEAALTRLTAVIHLIGSSYGWAVMKDYWGFDGAESGRAAADAIETLLGMPAGQRPQARAKKETKS